MADCVPIVLAYIEQAGQVLLTRRPAGVPQAGRWEFPGGKMEAGEGFADALQREIREEIGVTVVVGAEIAATCHAYPDQCVALHLFRCRLVAGIPSPCQVADVRWVPRSALKDYDFPPANAALLAALRANEG